MDTAIASIPTHIPVRANIYALKTLGVERVISVSAVGSLKEEFAPLDLVIPSQLIDRNAAAGKHLLRSSYSHPHRRR